MIIPKTGYAGLKSKKAQPAAAQEFSPPLEKPWFALRATKEKAARMGDKFQESLILVPLYDEVRTYFSTKC